MALELPLFYVFAVVAVAASALVIGQRSPIDSVMLLSMSFMALAGLDILPSGPRPTDPAELLSSPRLSQLLAWAETVYDQVLVDSPPTLVTSDVAMIGRLVDGIVLARVTSSVRCAATGRRR